MDDLFPENREEQKVRDNSLGQQIENRVVSAEDIYEGDKSQSNN